MNFHLTLVLCIHLGMLLLSHSLLSLPYLRPLLVFAKFTKFKAHMQNLISQESKEIKQDGHTAVQNFQFLFRNVYWENK